MTLLPVAPPEVPVDRSLTSCAPKFRAAVLALVADMAGQGFPTWIAETLRTPERQQYLYGFGRDYDDGRGKVTKAQTSFRSWHGYGLAADLVHATRYWNAAPAFWTVLGQNAEERGLTWGGRWKSPDRPHVQWGGCPVSPSAIHRVTAVVLDVWRDVGAA